ncbi:hypothetical protein C1H46_029948 [Malus baccata]|uniref:Uncharacterized protein n=1 Tax=Malus baccata TaxID=106549 RepID=A0A540LDG0_MALBA|nr:hypothetical protein C1H46_029948 [Malus baccata]
MDSQPTSSDAYTQSDTDKSGQQVGLERQGVVSEKMEDSANSLHEINVGASGNASKKTGSIKIKTSRELGSSVNHSTDPVPARTESPHKRESKMAGQDSRYNKQELGTLLIRLFDSCSFIRHHKADCLCAICVLKSHRREREENDRIAKSHGASDNSLAQELKQEESSLAESPGGNSSSDMDGSLEPNIDAEVEEKGEDTKMGVSKQQYGPSGISKRMMRGMRRKIVTQR